MIGYIEGEIIHKEDRFLVVLANSIGYTIFATPRTIADTTLGSATRFWTHLSVKEDALDLFGFAERDELSLFRLLIGISGIGPKSALNVLSLADTGTLLHAIQSGDSAYLTKVSGIGKKLAEKIVLELREKAGTITTNTSGVPIAETEAIEALEALGYQPRDTRELIRVLAKEHSTAQDIIRKALQTLGGR